MSLLGEADREQITGRCDLPVKFSDLDSAAFADHGSANLRLAEPEPHAVDGFDHAFGRHPATRFEKASWPQRWFAPESTAPTSRPWSRTTAPDLWPDSSGTWKACREFIKPAESGPWWDQELNALDRGLEWCRLQLETAPGFRFRLSGFALEPIDS